jgi:tetratricopeptide (TPR) repeat protein
MLCNHETYELYFGYANILNNNGRYEAAIKAYNKVIAMRPELVSAYVSLMFIYELSRIEKAKAIAFANTVLSKDPDNMYAMFVLGKNEKDVDKKISLLKTAT